MFDHFHNRRTLAALFVVCCKMHPESQFFSFIGKAIDQAMTGSTE